MIKGSLGLPKLLVVHVQPEYILVAKHFVIVISVNNQEIENEVWNKVYIEYFVLRENRLRCMAHIISQNIKKVNYGY